MTLSSSKSNSSKIYHIHIRKTAGTVIHTLLKQQFKQTEVCPIRSEFELNKGFPVNQRVSALNQYRMISGHFYTLGRHLIPEFKAVTFLRDPIVRTVSAFNHIQNANRDPYHKLLKGLTLGEALTSNRADLELNNAQTRFLVGNAGYNHRQLDNNSLSIAKSFIDQLFFVGVQEFIEPGIARLTQLMNIETPTQIHQINTKVTKSGIKVSELTNKELNLLQENNAYDLQVYEYVRKQYDHIN